MVCVKMSILRERKRDCGSVEGRCASERSGKNRGFQYVKFSLQSFFGESGEAKLYIEKLCAWRAPLFPWFVQISHGGALEKIDVIWRFSDRDVEFFGRPLIWIEVDFQKNGNFQRRHLRSSSNYIRA